LLTSTHHDRQLHAGLHRLFDSWFQARRIGNGSHLGTNARGEFTGGHEQDLRSIAAKETGQESGGERIARPNGVAARNLLFR